MLATRMQISHKSPAMRFVPFALALLGFCVAPVFADDAAKAPAPETVYEARTFTGADGKTLGYRLLKPKNYDAAKKYPLVIFLHGAGERGADNAAQLKHGAPLFAKPEVQEKYPCFVDGAAMSSRTKRGSPRRRAGPGRTRSPPSRCPRSRLPPARSTPCKRNSPSIPTASTSPAFPWAATALGTCSPATPDAGPRPRRSAAAPMSRA